MGQKHQIYLISDSTGETLDRIFLAIQSQFSNFSYQKKEFVFVRTEQQINKIIEECKKRELTIVDDNGKFSVLDKKGKKHPLNSEDMKLYKSGKEEVPPYFLEFLDVL